MDAQTLGRLRAVICESMQWDCLFSAAARHGVLPLLHLNLSQNGAAAIPDAVLRHLGNTVRGIARANFFLVAELLKLMQQFERRQIPAIPFKGAVLAAYAYGDVTLRQFGDVDIAVRKTDIPEASKLIISLGYDPTSERHLHDIHDDLNDEHIAFCDPAYYFFSRPDGRSSVDLQWRVAEEYFAFSLDKQDLWSRSVPVSIAGKPIPTFSPTDTLLILCVHGSKHRWEKLKWICDVAELVRAHGRLIDWQELQRIASAQHAERMVRLGLFLAQDLLGAELPGAVLEQVQSDVIVRSLAAQIQERLFLPGDEPAGKWNRLVFYLRSKDGWIDRIKFCLRYASQVATATIIPTPVERNLFPLPGRLSFLYYFIRPVRLLTKFGALMLMRPGK